VYLNHIGINTEQYGDNKGIIRSRRWQLKDNDQNNKNKDTTLQETTHHATQSPLINSVNSSILEG